MTHTLIQEDYNINTPPNAYDYYYDQYSRNDESRFLVEKRAWKTLKQNNSSDKYLTDKELEYVALINGFLKNSRYGVEYFTIDYLCEELEVTDRQLRTIRTNTSHIFKTKWRKATRSYKGRLENVYAIRPTEHTVFLLGETNYYKSEYNSFVNNSVKSVKLGSQFPTSYNIDENKNIIRSRANFSNVKNSNSQNLGTELGETKYLVAKGSCVNSQDNQQATEYVETPNEPQVVETTSPKAATVRLIRTKAPRPSNKRKTRTNAEQKQLRAANVPATKPAPKIVRNGFLGGGKRLSEIQPYLTDELCETLRSKSGKLFTNKAIREITKAIAASEKGSQAFFYHINGVVSYMIPALIREKRDPNKIGSESYYTKAGMTAEDKLLHEREKYLNETENSGIHARCDYTQYRARIAGQFPTNLAYTLLTNMVEVKREENVLKITMHKLVPLSEKYVQLLLKHAKGIGGYAGVNELEFVGIASNSNPSLLVGYPQETIQYAGQSDPNTESGQSLDPKILDKLMPPFFYTSALRQEGVDDVVQFLLSQATPSHEWPLDPGQSTSLTAEERIEEIVREKIYRCLHKEVPYNVQQENKLLKVATDRQGRQGVVIHQEILVKTKSHKELVNGSGGRTLERIRESAVQDLQKLFQCPVNLILHVKHVKSRSRDWSI